MSNLVIPLTDYLSPNFTLAELCHSNTAMANNIPNVPPSLEILFNLKFICDAALQPARDALGPIRVNNGYRSDALNAAVGGVSNSDHRLGLAADIVPLKAGVSVTDLARWFIRNLPKFDQVILEHGSRSNPTTVHIGMGSRMRRDVYYTPDLKTYTRITL